MTYENIGAPPPEAAGGGERKLGAALEGDLAEFVQSINGWYERINGQIVPTADDVPEGYRLATYVAFQPVDARLAQYMEIKNRGAPVVLCAQDDEAKKIWNKRLSVYTANESIDTRHGYARFETGTCRKFSQYDASRRPSKEYSAGFYS